MSVSHTRDLILKWMKAAMREAEKARGTCSPNPFVGAVIVKKGSIIASGHTQAYGSDHAEVQALKQAGEDARGADMYVTLEPCSHFGKTPPCTDAIIKAGIARVFVGIPDPNPLINPQGDGISPGIRKMQSAGIEVHSGYLQSQITRQLEYYLCRIRKRRPFVMIKSALSLDGKYAAQDGSSRWISSETSRRYTHRLREGVDVILAGISTVLQDDPLLTVRLPKPRRQPHRVILDAKLDISMDSALVKSLHIAPLTLFYQAALPKKSKIQKLTDLGVNLVPVSIDQDGLSLAEVLEYLHRQGVYSVMLESAGKLAASFFRQELADKLILFYGSKILGGNKAALSGLDLPNISAAIDFEISSHRMLGGDIMVIAYPKK